MCKYNTLSPVYVIRRANPFVADGWHKIHVDSCLAKEIQYLNDNGVITVNCCCGHGKGSSNCLIASESKKLAESLGYVVREYGKEYTKNNLLEIILKVAL